MKPLYIFDLDGTLSLADHRRPILEDKSNSKRWDEFYAACDKDLPNWSVITTLELLMRSGVEVWIFSGRRDSERGKTIEWLERYIEDPPDTIYMREAGDTRPDTELKREWLSHMSSKDRNRLKAVFDDRDRLVKMWRDEGIPCFQVAPGNF